MRLQAGKFAEALKAFLRSRPLKPEQAWFPQSQGHASLRRDLEAIVSRHAGEAWAFAWAGKLLAGLGADDLSAARRYLDRALELDPRHAWALLWLGELLYRAEGARAARPAVEKSVEAEMTSKNLGLRGRLRMDQGETGQALDDLDAALVLDRDDNELRAWRGEALARLERPLDALKELVPARLRVLDAPAPFFWRAEALTQTGRFEEALEAADGALRRRETFVPARMLKARVLKALGRNEEARRELIAAQGGVLQDA